MQCKEDGTRTKEITESYCTHFATFLLQKFRQTSLNWFNKQLAWMGHTLWELQNFTATILSQKFRQIIFFTTKELYCKLILRKKICVAVNFSFCGFHEIFVKIVCMQCNHTVEKRIILSHQKNISSNQLFSNLFSKTVTFTNFLPKLSEREFP